ncbi:hypothetical protein U0070_013251, partial [Myodes glareolus]
SDDVRQAPAAQLSRSGKTQYAWGWKPPNVGNSLEWAMNTNFILSMIIYGHGISCWGSRPRRTGERECKSVFRCIGDAECSQLSYWRKRKQGGIERQRHSEKERKRGRDMPRSTD